jgi:hypothetical protein
MSKVTVYVTPPSVHRFYDSETRHAPVGITSVLAENTLQESYFGTQHITWSQVPRHHWRRPPPL